MKEKRDGVRAGGGREVKNTCSSFRFASFYFGTITEKKKVQLSGLYYTHCIIGGLDSPFYLSPELCACARKLRNAVGGEPLNKLKPQKRRV
jgi:hypothetical protein